MLTQRVRYPEDGQMEELRSGYFDVPSSVTDKAGWLESQYREEMAKRLLSRKRKPVNRRFFLTASNSSVKSIPSCLHG